MYHYSSGKTEKLTSLFCRTVVGKCVTKVNFKIVKIVRQIFKPLRRFIALVGVLAADIVDIVLVHV